MGFFGDWNEKQRKKARDKQEQEKQTLTIDSWTKSSMALPDYDQQYRDALARMQAIMGSHTQFTGSMQGAGLYVSGGSALPTKPTTQQNSEMKFKVGDKIKFKDYDQYEYPHYRGQECVIIDLVSNGRFDYEVRWKDGNTSHVAHNNVVAKNPPKQKEFKLEKLDAVVLAPEVKDEIVAVIKQHKNSKKLFEEWGLGQVLEYGKGMTFMFYGPPGTGKTWAANCIAKVFDTEMITIGAAEIQTSEPGGANRNIQNAFKAAKEGGKVLFIDECDSLITSRSEVGMILGGEINTLLTEIEKAEGVVILATNRIENMDEALERRISLIVEFPEPNHDQRRQIWERLIPSKMPLEKGVTPEALAAHKLTGGQIKNVVLQAARLALSAEAKEVTMAHIESAITRLQKSKSLMGKRKNPMARIDYTKGQS